MCKIVTDNIPMAFNSIESGSFESKAKITWKNGQQFDAQGIYRLFTSASMRLTGKRMNPHLIRDLVVTHLRGTDASERQLEALAIYMGHSLQMQKSTYDKRTVEAKVAPAVDLLDSLHAKML